MVCECGLKPFLMHFSLTLIGHSIMIKIINHSGAQLSRTGNRVKIVDGPAAVIEDESSIRHWFSKGNWEDAASRLIRKSEDLPER